MNIQCYFLSCKESCNNAKPAELAVQPIPTNLMVPRDNVKESMTKTYLDQVGTGMKTWASGLNRLWKSAKSRHAPVPDKACTAATLLSARTLASSPYASFILWLLKATLPPMGKYSLQEQTSRSSPHQQFVLIKQTNNCKREHTKETRMMTTAPMLNNGSLAWSEKGCTT